MYERFWGFKQKPFDDAFQSEFFYPSVTHQGALLKLRYCVEQRLPAGLLVGPGGVGKTCLVRRLVEQLGDNISPCKHLVYPQVPATDLLYLITGELIQTNVESVSMSVCLQRLRDFLAENTASGRHALLVVDEAHLLRDPPSLEMLRLLLNFQSDGHHDLTLVLAGQPHLLILAARTSGFCDRISVKCLVSPLNAEESASYIRHRLSIAGARNDLFTPAAIVAACRLSEGVPRRIDRLCDLALLVGFAEERPEIDEAQIEGVHAEMAAFVLPEAA
jgi:general secretion pathway protein A